MEISCFHSPTRVTVTYGAQGLPVAGMPLAMNAWSSGQVGYSGEQRSRDTAKGGAGAMAVRSRSDDWVGIAVLSLDQLPERGLVADRIEVRILADSLEVVPARADGLVE